MAEQATAANQVTTAVETMRKESEQAARAMGEQSRAMKEISGATANISRQMRLVSTANREHSAGAVRVLGQLKSVRAVSERNTQGVRESRGTTGQLLEHAEALRAVVSRSSGKNGAPRRNGGNGRA
jgi:methyl-accepting chemotaxis protein